MKTKTIIQDFLLLSERPNGRKWEEHPEGILVSGMLTRFGETNFNGFRFAPGSYDKCIAEYFEANGLNVPLTVQHNDNDIRHVVGRVTKMEKRDDGVYMEAVVLSGHPEFETVKCLIDGGVLQGFSNYGWAHSCGCTEDGAIVVEEFSLLSASLVTTPADVSGKLEMRNTRFEGFSLEKEEEKNETEDIYSIF